MKKVLFVLGFFVFGLSLFAGLIEDIQNRGVLRIGQDSGYMPLYGTDETGKRIGLEVALAEEMARVLGVRLEFVIVNWDGVISALVAGKFDMIWAGMTISPQRALKVNFSDPYLTVGQVVVYSNKEYTTEPTYAWLKTKKNKIAVQLGSTGDEAARRSFTGSEFLDFDTMDEVAFQVATGRVDFCVVDSTYARYIAKKYGILRIGSVLLTTEDLGIAIKKGDLEALLWINTFIRAQQVSGKMDELKAVWFDTYNPDL
jgi:polar amino acid transport system substrate-binding protein